MSSSPRAPQGSLKHGHLGFADVVAQAVGTIAPSGTPAFVILGVFATAGNGTWLAYLFATLALLLLALNLNVFASRSASPGALYTFAGQGLGPFWGNVSGWALVIAYLFTAGAVVSGSVNYAEVVLAALFGTGSGPALAAALSLAVIGGAFLIAWRSIRLSTRVSLAAEAVTVGAILLVLVAALVHGGGAVDSHQLSLDGVSPDSLRLGLVLAFFSFVGFESATVLGHEARDPLRLIPRSVIVTVLATGIFFVVAGYILVAAFQGVEPGLDKTDAPLSLLAGRVGLGALGPVIAAGVSASFFASALASINAAARVIFLLSRHGVLHPRAGDAHATHATPHVAIAASAAIVVLLSLPLTLGGVGLLDSFAYLGTVATFGFLVAYILVSVAAPLYLRQRGELKPVNLLLSAASVLLLILPLVGVLYPVPDYPLNLLPYLFVALLAAGTLYFLRLRRVSPAVLDEIQADLDQASSVAAGARS